MKTILKLQEDIKEWSNQTFGDEHRRLPISKHLKEEVDEIIQITQHADTHGYNTISEYAQAESALKMQVADCLILIMDLLSKYGYTMEEAFLAVKEKMRVNKNRVWEGPDENGLYHHKITK
jgi:NTP pyrophosphatase (non-canonical NTP hydrolase)